MDDARAQRGATITARLAEFALHEGGVGVPDTVRAMARLSMGDWLAVGIAGAGEPVAQAVRRLAEAEGGQGQAQVFGSDACYPARMAALVNGATSHALDYDDTHFAHIGHPSVAVFPAVLALGQHLGVSGRALQEAALIGMEVSIRVGIWLGRQHYQVGYHQTATAGTFGAALAAARLLGLSPEQGAHVLGLAATRGSGLKAQFGTMGKPYNAGIAAANGVEAAQLVALGFESNPGALEHDQGFGPTHHGAGDTRALDGLGERWLFESISHKFHACCHGLHAALEAAAALPADPDDIAAIEVRTHPRWMSVCNQPAPGTGLGAKFSYATVLAMHYLGHDTAALDSYSDAVCADPRVGALRGRVTVSADPSLSEMQAQLVLVLKSGARRRAAHDLDTPPALAERATRLRAKAQALLGAARAAAIWKAVDSEAAPEAIGAALNV